MQKTTREATNFLSLIYVLLFDSDADFKVDILKTIHESRLIEADTKSPQIYKAGSFLTLPYIQNLIILY